MTGRRLAAALLSAAGLTRINSSGMAGVKNGPGRQPYRVTAMQPVLSVEFTARSDDVSFQEESVHLHTLDELFEYVAPGGGCERIPSEVSEIRMVFLRPVHPNARNPAADQVATLQLGMVFFTGPLAEISQLIEQLVDRSGRGELSRAFLSVTGLPG